MDDNRSTQYAAMLLKRDRSADDYTMQEAVRDIVDYYNAGTLIRAFTQLSKDTGERANASEKRVLSLKGVPALEDIVTIPEESLDAAKKIQDKFKAVQLIVKGGTQERKKDAAEQLRSTYLDVFKDSDFKPVMEKLRTDEALTENVKKFEDADETQGKTVGADEAFRIVRKIYTALDLAADSKLIIKLNQYLDKHKIK